LQDAQNPTVAKSLGFSLYKDLVLVAPYLEEHGCTDILYDSRLKEATQYITDRDRQTGDKIDRFIVDQRVAQKQRLADELVKEYAAKTESLDEEEIQRCIDSIADAIAYVESTQVSRLTVTPLNSLVTVVTPR
jgi:Protein of unknown function (DUF2009)